MKLGKSYLLYVGLLCVLGCAGVVFFRVSANDGEIDMRIADLNNSITEKEMSLIKINEQMLYDRKVYESALDAFNATSGLRIQANKELQDLYEQKKTILSGAFTNRLPEAEKLGNQSEAEQKP